MEAKLVELEIRVNGRQVKEYQHEGKVYIEGRKGSEFALRVRNRTFARVLATLSVDGLSVMDGKEASYDSGGYIIDPMSHIDIPGWRLDLNEVAKFFFAKHGSSYAAQMGKPKDVGVIGCAIFCERVPAITWTSGVLRSCCLRGLNGLNGPILTGPIWTGGDTTVTSAELSHNALYSACAADGQPATQVQPELGTGFGPAEEHKVVSTCFERASNQPDELLQIHYNSREGLTRLGIDVKKKPTIATPNPFPGQKAFCKAPAGWSRRP